MHTDPEYVEHQEGPDGQYCDLLTRVPYDRQRMIEIALRDGQTNGDAMDAILRGMMWECSVKNDLTGEMSDRVEWAGSAVVQPWRLRAVELYNAWYKVAFPGPKGLPRTGSPTRTSGKTGKASATSGRG